MPRLVRSIVAAVVATLMADIEPPEDLTDGADAFAVAFVISQIERMPGHLRAAMLALETAFDAGAIALHRKRFHRLGQPQRAAYLASWTNSKLGVRRDFVRFHRSLTVFALYSKRSSAA